MRINKRKFRRFITLVILTTIIATACIAVARERQTVLSNYQIESSK